MTAATAAYFERRLAREGLGSLDHSDGAGGIRVGNRGSGKLLDAGRAFARASATLERRQRQTILATHRFRRGERKIYALYATGLSLRQIERRTGVGYVSVFRLVARVEKEHREAPEMTFAEMLAASEPRTIVLFWTLLERAIEKPEEVREIMGKARGIPEIRQILEPDETALPLDVDDGHRRHGAPNSGGSTEWSERVHPRTDGRRTRKDGYRGG